MEKAEVKDNSLIKKNGKISGLIFKELVRRGYSIEGDTRVWNIADSKLWYLTPEQAQAYLDMDHSPEYEEAVHKEQSNRLLQENADLIIKKFNEGAVNVIDLGCGDGKKATEIIQKFGGKLKIRYCPIDISGYMVQKAIETFSKMDIHEIVEFQYNISDFENLSNITPLLTKGEFKRNLFLLLGNTLGNFEITSLLYEIRSSMKDGDLLLVDTSLANKKIEEVVNLHSKNDLSKRFVFYIPKGLGLKEDEVEYGVRFKNSRVEIYFIIKEDRTIKLQERKVELRKGDKMIVGIAYKHNLDDLKMYFNMFFGSVETVLSDDKAQAFILCQK